MCETISVHCTDANLFFSSGSSFSTLHLYLPFSPTFDVCLFLFLSSRLRLHNLLNWCLSNALSLISDWNALSIIHVCSDIFVTHVRTRAFVRKSIYSTPLLILQSVYRSIATAIQYRQYGIVYTHDTSSHITNERWQKSCENNNNKSIVA